MNYYPFHIGDYAKKTRHLSWDEDMAYRRLMDAYYLNEGPLPGDKRQIYRLVMATSKAQREAVDVVLAEFFDAKDDGFSNHRCDEELAKWKVKGEKASASAKAKWDRAKAYANAPQNDANAMRAQCEGNANHNQEPEPITKTNSALTSAKSARASEPEVQQVDPTHWQTSQAILVDHESDLDDWELDFLHSIKWKPSISKAQAEKLKAIQDKVLAIGKPAVALPSVRRGSPQYEAWIGYYRKTKGSSKFYERLDVLTVPSEFPPRREAAQ